MNDTLLNVAYGLVFLTVVLLAEVGFRQFSAARANKHVNRRLGLIAEGKSRDEVLQLLRRNNSGHRSGSPLAGMLNWLDGRLTQAGIGVPAHKVLLGMAAATAVIGVVFPALAQLSGRFNSAGAFALLVLFAIGVGVGLPIMFINMKAAKRVKQFDKQFPVALDIFVRGLRAGHPVSSALELLTSEMADPCGSEFGIVIDETNYGLELREALSNLADRINSQDVQMFVVCVGIQNETGGNLAEILDGLTKVIRERASMVMKVKALASEGKMTGGMLTFLPIFTFTTVFSSQPGFYLDVADDSWFVPGLCGVLGMYVMGVLMIRKLIDLKV